MNMISDRPETELLMEVDDRDEASADLREDLSEGIFGDQMGWRRKRFY